jgi:uncharacterized lipoprotein YbaY
MSHAATFLLAACTLLTALTGCGVTSGSQAAAAGRARTVESLSVRGALIYEGGIALPQDGFAIVELRETEPPRAVIAEQHIDLQGRSLPVPFELVVDRAMLVNGGTYAVRGAVKQGAKASWATDPVVIDTTSGAAVDLGLQAMKPVVVVAFGSDWDCGGQRIAIGMAGDLLRVVMGDDYLDMRPVVAASGSKYEAMDDPTTTLLNKGHRATLTVRGKAYPECVWVSNSE